MPSSFGSLALRRTSSTEYIGQPVDYSERNLVAVEALSIDSRIDFIKIDIEGMEMEALAGAAESIAQHRPAMLIESIKSDAEALQKWLKQHDYVIFRIGINILAVHKEDLILPHFRQRKS
jgi:Methyltransferase FkbM domain